MQTIVELIEKFLRNQITKDELDSLRRMVVENKVNEDYFSSYYQTAWDNAGLDKSEIDPDVEKRIWQNLNSHLYAKKKKMLQPKRWMQVAAFLAVALSFSALGYWFAHASDNAPETVVVKTEVGEKAQVQLPDGTRIWLNSASKLTYSSRYGETKREVNLLGEAYFEVEANRKKPFVVVTPDEMHVKALGTKFNVRYYLEDSQAESYLLEGKLEVTNNNISEILLANEKIIINKHDGTFRKNKMDEHSTAQFWMNNWLVLEGQSLEDVANILKRKFQVDVVFQSEEIKSVKYTGKVKSGKLEDILSLISTVSPVVCTTQGAVITFSK